MRIDSGADVTPTGPIAEAPVVQPVAPAKPEIAAKPLPKGDTYGPVKRGDTLSKIAKQYKPGNVTLDQMLKAYGNHPPFFPRSVG